jgi:hypothetical protein
VARERIFTVCLSFLYVGRLLRVLLTDGTFRGIVYYLCYGACDLDIAHPVLSGGFFQIRITWSEHDLIV